MNKLLEFLFGLFGRKQPRPTPAPSLQVLDNATEPVETVTSRVLVIVYDPVMDSATGKKLSEQQNWYGIEPLASGFMNDIVQCSGGVARYQVVQRIDLDEFPAKVDGFRYSPQSYMDVLRGVTPPHTPQEVDYISIISRFKILERVAHNEIDEVWIFGFPHAGFYESTMGGPGAFWCNSPALKNTEASGRRFVIMGFSFERYIGEMLESFGHRVESTMQRAFARLNGDANLWNRFTRYDHAAPGKAAIGSIHFAPNSLRDYQWDSPAVVKSECYDWLNNFPNFKGDIRDVAPAEWGGGEIRAHHRWWLSHIPHCAGRRNGILNNWWAYIIKPSSVV
jgi:hypothetical protein